MFFFQFSGKIALRGEAVRKLGKDGGVFAARSLEKVSGGDYTLPKISVGLYWHLAEGRVPNSFDPKKGWQWGVSFPCLLPGSRMRLIFQKNSERERILPESLLNHPARIDYLSQFPQNSDDFHTQNSHDSHRILQKTTEFCRKHQNSAKSTRILQNPLEFCNIRQASPKSTRIPLIRAESICQNSADSYRFW